MALAAFVSELLKTTLDHEIENVKILQKNG